VALFCTVLAMGDVMLVLLVQHAGGKCSGEAREPVHQHATQVSGMMKEH
jgi:hypothetical protein